MRSNYNYPAGVTDQKIDEHFGEPEYVEEEQPRAFQHVNTGNSSKVWVATWRHTGSKVLTPSGERTTFCCGAREAEIIERNFGVYLWEEK